MRPISTGERQSNRAALREEFGIRYLLEGSVRKAGNQVRISARLIDAVEDRHLWAERYDRPLTDIFALQDDIASKILTALRVNLTDEERRRFERAPTTNLEAYDFYLRAQKMTRRARRGLRPELMDEAAKLYEKAIALDPEYAVAYGALGLNRWLTWFYGWNPDGDASIESALALYDQALALDGTNPPRYPLRDSPQCCTYANSTWPRRLRMITSGVFLRIRRPIASPLTWRLFRVAMRMH